MGHISSDDSSSVYSLIAPTSNRRMKLCPEMLETNLAKPSVLGIAIPETSLSTWTNSSFADDNKVPMRQYFDGDAPNLPGSTKEQTTGAASPPGFSATVSPIACPGGVMHHTVTNPVQCPPWRGWPCCIVAVVRGKTCIAKRSACRVQRRARHIDTRSTEFVGSIGFSVDCLPFGGMKRVLILPM